MPPTRPSQDGALWVVGGALIRDGACLSAQRPPGGSAGRKWEFPGGKVELHETAVEALVRELAEELGVEVRVGEFVGRSEFFAGDRLIVLDVYFVELIEGEPMLREHLAFRWVNALELDSLDWATADLPLLPRVRRELEAKSTSDAN